MIVVRPLTLSRACSFVKTFHRHNKPPQGHRFSIGLIDPESLFEPDGLIGVAIVGRPVARRMDDEVTAEVTRLCVLDIAPKGSCSQLYRHSLRAWK